MRSKSALALLLSFALLLGSSPLLVSAAFPSSALFLSHFDGNTKNERSGDVGVSSGISFTSGKFGQGVKFSGSDYLYYSSTGNIKPSVGTAEFWYKPNEAWGGVKMNPKFSFFTMMIMTQILDGRRIGSQFMGAISKHQAKPSFLPRSGRAAVASDKY